MIGRRVAGVADLERPGDYCGPIEGYTGGKPAVFFLLPNAPEPRGTHDGHGSVHHVTSPPHQFRECEDGSLEIRASIGAQPFWHGYLDAGHSWRNA